MKQAIRPWMVGCVLLALNNCGNLGGGYGLHCDYERNDEGGRLLVCDNGNEYWESAELTGKVTKVGSDDPSGVMVTVEQTGDVDTTDDLGLYHFANLLLGTYTLRIEAVGYPTAVMEEVIVLGQVNEAPLATLGRGRRLPGAGDASILQLSPNQERLVVARGSRLEILDLTDDGLPPLPVAADSARYATFSKDSSIWYAPEPAPDGRQNLFSLVGYDLTNEEAFTVSSAAEVPWAGFFPVGEKGVLYELDGGPGFDTAFVFDPATAQSQKVADLTSSSYEPTDQGVFIRSCDPSPERPGVCYPHELHYYHATQNRVLEMGDAPVSCLSRDQKRVVLDSGLYTEPSFVAGWNLESGERLWLRNRPTDWLQYPAFSEDCTTMAICNRNRDQLLFVDTDSGQTIARDLEGLVCVDVNLSPSGASAVVVDDFSGPSSWRSMVLVDRVTGELSPLFDGEDDTWTHPDLWWGERFFLEEDWNAEESRHVVWVTDLTSKTRQRIFGELTTRPWWRNTHEILAKQAPSMLPLMGNYDYATGPYFALEALDLENFEQRVVQEMVDFDSLRATADGGVLFIDGDRVLWSWDLASNHLVPLDHDVWELLVEESTLVYTVRGSGEQRHRDGVYVAPLSED